jgi:hypothetical protein
VPQVITADTTGTAVDLRDCNAASIVFAVGANAATQTLNSTNKLELQLLESSGSATGTSTGTYTAVAQSDLTSGVTGSTRGAFYSLDSTAKLSASGSVGYVGSKRFIQVKADEFGTVSIPTSAIIVKDDVNVMPR